MDRRVQEILAAYAYLMSDDFVGPRERQTIIVIDSFSQLEDRIFGHALDMCMIDIPTPCEAWMDYERPALPKPMKQRLFIKEPRRQSFRQSMRSVNRNR